MQRRDALRSGARRRFLQTVALAGLGVLAPAHVLAQARKAAKKPATPPKAAPAPPAAPGPTPPSDDAKAIAEILARRYPGQLDATKLAGVTRELDQRLDGSKRLRAVKLANAVEPDTTFRA